MQHDPFEPSFVVDVTAVWEAKLAALAAYRSQLHGRKTARRDDEPVTKVARPASSRWPSRGGPATSGCSIGATFGEPFWSRLPLAVADLFGVLPGGVR